MSQITITGSRLYRVHFVNILDEKRYTDVKADTLEEAVEKIKSLYAVEIISKVKVRTDKGWKIV